MWQNLWHLLSKTTRILKRYILPKRVNDAHTVPHWNQPRKSHGFGELQSSAINPTLCY